MVNFLGPGAFDCARPAVSRPIFTPDNLPGDVDDWFKNCTSPLARDGTEWRAELLNFIIALLRSSVRKGGIAESNLDDDILTRAFRHQGYNYFPAVTGSANAIAIAPDPAIAAPELPGMPIVLKTGAGANTGAVTLAINLLSPVAVTWPDGTPLVAGDLPAGHLVTLRHDGTAFRLMASKSPAQIVAAVLKIPLYGVTASWSQSLSNTLQTYITSFTVLNSNLGDATFASGTLTVGPQTEGLWISIFSAISPSAGTEVVAITLDNNPGGSAIGFGTSQTSNGAPGAVAVSIAQRTSGQKFAHQSRQISGGSMTITGRLSMFRLSA